MKIETTTAQLNAILPILAAMKPKTGTEATQKVSPIARFNAILQIIAAEEARKAGKHLRLVVNNTVTP